VHRSAHLPRLGEEAERAVVDAMEALRKSAVDHR
jgi:hypothetical protein